MKVSEVLLNFPEFFEKADVSIGEGWSELLRQLCQDIQDARLDVKFSQIKEKFGQLRIYYDISEYTQSDYEKVSELVSKYERMSASICEFTGKPGQLRTVRSWVKVCSDEVYAEALKRGFWL